MPIRAFLALSHTSGELKPKPGDAGMFAYQDLRMDHWKSFLCLIAFLTLHACNSNRQESCRFVWVHLIKTAPELASSMSSLAANALMRCYSGA